MEEIRRWNRKERIKKQTKCLAQKDEERRKSRNKQWNEWGRGRVEQDAGGKKYKILFLTKLNLIWENELD